MYIYICGMLSVMDFNEPYLSLARNWTADWSQLCLQNSQVLQHFEQIYGH